MSEDRNVALRWTICRDVGSGVLLELSDEICILADRLDTETSAKICELFALETVKRIWREEHIFSHCGGVNGHRCKCATALTDCRY